MNDTPFPKKNIHRNSVGSKAASKSNCPDSNNCHTTAVWLSPLSPLSSKSSKVIIQLEPFLQKGNMDILEKIF